MPDATKKPIKKRGGWSAARQHLATWDKPALLALVKFIYDAAAVYRDFMQARCPAVVSGGEVLEKKIGARSWSSSFLPEASAN